MRRAAKRSTALALLAALSLSACGATGSGGHGGGYGAKQTGGALLGAVVGGVAGSRFGGGTGKLLAVGVGTLLGAAVGSAAGASLDRADEAYARHAEAAAYRAPLGHTVEWRNPDSRNHGTITPVNDGYDRRSGSYCREFQTTISVGGRLQQGHGTACQRPDGSWKIVG